MTPALSVALRNLAFSCREPRASELVPSDHLDRLFELGDRGEGIARAADEQRVGVEVWQMLSSLLLGLARWM